MLWSWIRDFSVTKGGYVARKERCDFQGTNTEQRSIACRGGFKWHTSLPNGAHFELYFSVYRCSHTDHLARSSRRRDHALSRRPYINGHQTPMRAKRCL